MSKPKETPEELKHRLNAALRSIVDDLEAGRIYPEDLPEDLIENFRRVLSDQRQKQSTIPMMNLPGRSLELALHWHGDQQYGDRPYRVHLDAARDVLLRTGLATPELEAAVNLHDTLEDTKATAGDLLQAGIPATVVEIVKAVTDEPGENRKERKARTYPKIANSRDAVLVKLCDRIANVEAGGKWRMYADEQDAFRAALCRPEHRLDKVWEMLEGALLEKMREAAHRPRVRP